MVWVPSDLRKIQEQVQQGQAPTLTVRRLLSWFSSERRGSRVVSSIHAALRELSLTTRPNFEDAWIDGEVSFFSTSPQAAPATSPEPEAGPEPPPGPTPGPGEEPAGQGGAGARPDAPAGLGGSPGAAPGDASTDGSAPGPASPPPVFPIPVVEPLAQKAPNVRHDPVFRLGKLDAANQKLTAVSPDTPLERAVTVMMLNDFSQLPVITSVSRIEGAVTWRSIALAHALRKPPVLVKDCLGFAPVYQADDSVFEALDDIMQYGFVLVISQKKLQGIVTLVDVAAEFHGSFEPFVLIGEIERHLRVVIDRSLPLEQLQALCGSPEGPPIESATSLSFGQYRRLLERPDVWELCGLHIDRVETITRIDRIRELRNEMMHFQREALEDKDVQDIREFAVFLREVLR